MRVCFVFIAAAISQCLGSIWNCNSGQTNLYTSGCLPHDGWDRSPEICFAATKCASQGGSCSLSEPGVLYYGAEQTWTYELVYYPQTFQCSDAGLGCDPLPLFSKNCYFKPYSPMYIAPSYFDPLDLPYVTAQVHKLDSNYMHEYLGVGARAVDGEVLAAKAETASIEESGHCSNILFVLFRIFIQCVSMCISRRFERGG